VDGDFDTNTENAVKAFQNKCGIGADGIVVGGTWPRLGPNVYHSMPSYWNKSKSISETGLESSHLHCLWTLVWIQCHGPQKTCIARLFGMHLHHGTYVPLVLYHFLSLHIMSLGVGSETM